MSSHKQETSPAQQRREIIELANRLGYEIVAWYIEWQRKGQPKCRPRGMDGIHQTELPRWSISKSRSCFPNADRLSKQLGRVRFAVSETLLEVASNPKRQELTRSGLV